MTLEPAWYSRGQLVRVLAAMEKEILTVMEKRIVVGMSVFFHGGEAYGASPGIAICRRSRDPFQARKMLLAIDDEVGLLNCRWRENEAGVRQRIATIAGCRIRLDEDERRRRPDETIQPARLVRREVLLIGNGPGRDASHRIAIDSPVR